jgi:peroxiredoxin
MHYAKTRDLPFIVAMDSDGTAAKAFGKVEQTPTTFVVGKNGKVLKRYVGEPDWIEFRSVLKEALKANAS